MSTTVLPPARAATPRTPRRRRRIALIAAGSSLGVLALAYVADLALASDRLPRGVRVADVDLGGKRRAEARALLTERFRAWSAEPIAVTVADPSGTGPTAVRIDPAAAGLGFDVEATLAKVRRGSHNPLDRLRGVFADQDIQPVVTVDQGRLTKVVGGIATEVDRRPREGAVRFEGTTPVAVLPETGRRLDREGSAAAIRAAFTDADRRSTASSGRPTELPVGLTAVKSTAAAVRLAFEGLARPAVSAPVQLLGGGRRVEIRPADIAASLRIEADSSGAMVPQVLQDRLEKALGTRLAGVDVRPRDAGFVLSGGAVRITPSRPGRELDLQQLSRRLLPVLRRAAPRSVQVPVRAVAPRLTTERARTLGVKQPIGGFTTRHPCCAPRVRNIQLMARIVDGAVVLPGETFSLNGFVGRRDRGRGFVEAPMILDGEFVDAVGGGVSQFATTMFNAVFFSGMQDISHRPHSYYISRYPPGREATVSIPAPDLKWRNDSRYGVLIDTSYTGTSITVTFWSTKRYDIQSISGPRRNIRPFFKAYRSGPDCVPVSGAEGFDIVVTRVFRQGGREIRRERFFTRYKPEPNFICGKPPPPKPEPSPSPSPSPSPPPPSD